MVSKADKRLPKEFLWRRLHSIFGLLIVLFLIEHFLTNSQSALLFGQSGEGFIKAVNFIKNLPYLPVIEVLLIGVPIVVHGALGVRYALTGKMNSFLDPASHLTVATMHIHGKGLQLGFYL
jgi:succinate dehydrogenase / fumarate reductase cytochrome b subunit